MKVGVIGSSTSRFGELWDTPPRLMLKRTIDEALSDAMLSLSSVDAIFVGNMLAGMLGGQKNLGSIVAEELGVSIPAIRVEAACASGGLAVHNGVVSILSKEYDTVLVVGLEKMTDHASDEVAVSLMGAGSSRERDAGLTFPGLYAVMARAHMEQYGTTEEQMAAASVKNHYHATHNPKAQFQKAITVENVMQSMYVADPLKLLDCSPISDGAAAVLLSSEEVAKRNKKREPVWIVASQVATDTLSISKRKSITSVPAAKKAADQAYKRSGIRPSDVDVAEVHDCFSIAEIMALEDLGFYQKGKAASAIENGEVTCGTAKNLVINTSGGLKACGHPVGATGIKQIAELTKQLRGETNGRQVKGARVGLAHNVGGSGAIAVVHILKK